MKLAIVGGRDFDDYERLEIWADELKPTEIVSGGAKGADALAEEYAKRKGIPITVIPAKWDDMSPPCKFKRNVKGELYNALAGMNRNTAIVENCDIILAFWNRKSSGTKDTIEKAKKSGKKTMVCFYGEAREHGTEIR